MRRLRTLCEKIALSVIALLAGLMVSELIVRNFIPVRNVGPSFSVYDPFYGKSLKKSFSCRRITPEFSMTFTTNSEGFRGPEIGSLTRRPILFLGDSFTMGYGVNDGEEFPALVGKALNESRPDTIKIINGGMGDNGNGRWIKFLRNDAKRYDPSIVVFQIHDNDFYDNRNERLFELSPASELRELPVPAQKTIRIVQRIIDHIPYLEDSYFVGLFRQVQWSFLYAQGDTNIKMPIINTDRELLEKQLLIRLMEEVLTICEKERWKVLFVLADISPPRLDGLETFFEDNNIPTIIIPNKQERPDLYYQVDMHWNVSGHKFVADQILEGINKYGLVNYW
jgi:hypothetical protein